MSGRIYMAATPIGNLKDVTFRVKEALEKADFVLCEDTRVTSKLLAGLGISKPLKSWHQRSAEGQLTRLVEEIAQGRQVVYVSDAGTPGVNDPGGMLAESAMKAGVEVVPLPGPSALTAAISVCGFPMERFVYLGFAPHKKGRQTFFKEISDKEEAVVFFESTHRLVKAMESLSEVLGEDRMVFVGRELTKLHETLYRGSAQEVLSAIKASSDKGEAVIVIAPNKYRQ